MCFIKYKLLLATPITQHNEENILSDKYDNNNKVNSSINKLLSATTIKSTEYHDIDIFFEKHDNNNDEINLVASPRDYYFKHAISDVEDIKNSDSKPIKQANQEKSNNLEESYPKEPDNKSTKDVESNPIREIFNQVFVNDFWICDSLIEKLYYFAKIYSRICHLCRDPNIAQSISNKILPICKNCAAMNSSTKY
ncbi:19981_t:CDS:2 [Racocetra persica]|uniref:19981_t:CDS:1 n=1 Tax=Racocetra persica TaxID=160502 RepID=A0ACA9L0Y2_9GLOM|nr:19981_t:CDS:2 [Racocetra persica]